MEEILNQVPGIEESACVGMPDSEGVMGEVVKAYIVSKDTNLTDKEIIAYLQPRLENYKIPVQFVRIDSIPKTTSGKIQRLKLKTL